MLKMILASIIGNVIFLAILAGAVYLIWFKFKSTINTKIAAIKTKVSCVVDIARSIITSITELKEKVSGLTLGSLLSLSADDKKATELEQLTSVEDQENMG